MKKSFKAVSFLICILLLATSLALAQREDLKGSKDHPLFNRMSNYYIDQYEDYEFDSQEFISKEQGRITVEGHKYYIRYHLQKDAKIPSGLQIIRNYTNAIKKIGGTIEREHKSSATMKFEKDNQETWIHIQTRGKSAYSLAIVEKGGMVQEIVASPETSENFSKSINETGKATVYGIHFDTDKAEIKPESEQTLIEIAKLLSENPELKVYIVGHTDSTGTFEHNMKLSQARAEATVNVLTSKYGVAADRVTPYSIGPLAPIASNKTEEGRALNRRAEIVEK